MKSHSEHAKTRISAVVPVFIVDALRHFQKSSGLKSMSAAAAQALADWAEDSQRDARVKKALDKYAAAYSRDASFGEALAEKMLPLMKSSRPRP